MMKWILFVFAAGQAGLGLMILMSATAILPQIMAMLLLLSGSIHFVGCALIEAMQRQTAAIEKAIAKGFANIQVG